jgi:hypothetical protein
VRSVCHSAARIGVVTAAAVTEHRTVLCRSVVVVAVCTGRGSFPSRRDSMMVSDSNSPSDSSMAKVIVANPVAGTTSQVFVETGAAALTDAPTLAFESVDLVL